MNVLGAASLGGNFSAGAAIGAGLVGGLVFLMVVYMGLGTGMTRMNFLPMLGSMMAPKAPRSTTYAIGFAIHMMASAVFGLINAGLLTGFGAMTPMGPLLAHVAFGLVTGSIYAAVVL